MENIAFLAVGEHSCTHAYTLFNRKNMERKVGTKIQEGLS